jgi:hypothetical protein
MGFIRKIKIKDEHIMCEEENDQLWKNSWSIKDVERSALNQYENW